MSQCAGTTLKGERCKREAREGSSYCSIHFEQPPRPDARAEPEPVSASDASASTRIPWDAEWMKAAIGLAVLGVILLFRGRR
jgi:hypothetical protein